jgi:hypothetical protein
VKRIAVVAVVVGLGACQRTNVVAAAKTPDAALAATAAACGGPGCMPGFRSATIDGGEVTTDTFRGKVALIVFWASWCEPCTNEGPGIESVYRARRGDGFAMLGLSRDTVDDATLRRFRDERGFSFPIARATVTTDQELRAPAGVPAFVLYGRDGRERWRMTGALPASVLERELDAALADVSVARGAVNVVVVDGLERDPKRVAAGIARLRADAPTVAILTGSVRAEARAVNSLHFDAWAAGARPAGVATPIVNGYLVATAAGARIAVATTMDAAAAARADGAVDAVVGLRPGVGDASPIPAEGQAAAVRLTWDDGRRVHAESLALERW